MDSCLVGWLEVAIACHYRFPVKSELSRSHQQSQVGRTRQQRVN